MKKVTERTRLALLGIWQLEIDGQLNIGPNYNKGRALLAYLAIGKGPQSREAISALLWPDSAGHLRRVLSNLRTTLDIGNAPPCLLSEGGALALNPQYPLWMDVSAFTEPLACHADSSPEYCAGCLNGMKRKAALYRGEFMAGFSIPECEAFEDWLQQQRETLRCRMLTLLERLWQCHEQNGKPDKALTYAQRYVEMEPWNDAGQRQLIRLMAVNGQAAAALSQFETYRRLLDRELGVLPEQETLMLIEQIRVGNFDTARNNTLRLSPASNEPVSEHRLLTMLYCGFDAPGVEDLDDLAETLQLPQQQSEEIIARHSGHIVQSQRHGILACFGFPSARENAARHAVRAALTIRDAMPAAISARIGVHSGMVIAQAGIPDIMGMTAAYATDMAEYAEAGAVLISEVTERLTMGYFRIHPLGTQSRQGMAKPLAVLRVEGESGANSRLESAERLTPLVGRSAELAQLRACWEQARQGMGQTVLIRGDAGIGKSRLVHDLAAQLTGHIASRELRCFPEFSQSPLHPVLALCESLCGFDAGDAEADKLEKLSTYLLAHHPALADEALELIAPLFHLPTKTPSALSPQNTKTAHCRHTARFAAQSGGSTAAAADHRRFALVRPVHIGTAGSPCPATGRPHPDAAHRPAGIPPGTQTRLYTGFSAAIGSGSHGVDRTIGYRAVRGSHTRHRRPHRRHTAVCRGNGAGLADSCYRPRRNADLAGIADRSPGQYQRGQAYRLVGRHTGQGIRFSLVTPHIPANSRRVRTDCRNIGKHRPDTGRP